MKENYIKSDQIATYQSYLKTTAEQLALCNELINALQSHKGKLIDKRFFSQFESPERTAHIYMLYKQWEFSTTHNYRIRIQARQENERATRGIACGKWYHGQCDPALFPFVLPKGIIIC